MQRLANSPRLTQSLDPTPITVLLNPTQPNLTHDSCQKSTQPNRWMDQTHVHLWATVAAKTHQSQLTARKKTEGQRQMPLTGSTDLETGALNRENNAITHPVSPNAGYAAVGNQSPG